MRTRSGKGRSALAFGKLGSDWTLLDAVGGIPNGMTEVTLALVTYDSSPGCIDVDDVVLQRAR